MVVGAGQAGLSTSRHLARRAVRHVVLDAESSPGGAWQHRPRSMRMADVHGVAQLPDLALPALDPATPAREAIPAYFADYEERFALPVLRPVRVSRVEESEGGLLRVVTGDGRALLTRTLVSAAGTWSRPFVPAVPGAGDFLGEQMHSSGYDGPERFAGRRVLVVGGGTSAVQILGEIGTTADTLWVTRRPPLWRAGGFGAADGRAAVALVADRVRAGRPPGSVVSVTGLSLREQEQDAARAGAFERLPLFDRIVPDGVVWADGRRERVDVIVWATGFRPEVGHLAPLRLRGAGGGIAMDGTTVRADPRLQLVGYGPSASTIGANRAGRQAAIAVRRFLAGLDEAHGTDQADGADGTGTTLSA
ncbi:NAD(P)/FAD-dependent oxidoreductase [Nocardioides sp. MJB4]|uniref:NAD(P)/FAD-dependent oxidoreductase n=1 Tax=Nocardioides donggukensis TaxID=2774019 RepID=A0A927K305_9ACTN|nr:NAD(P)/FAD-dependent oxidoreductase [Nocardioides donggukensis]